jgi:RNA polymerase sigma-70 factor (ECF subfamily)
MEPSDVPSTSPTLLGQLADRTNNQAWCTFMQRYKPPINRWCRRWGLQPADVDDVSAHILAKLTKAMTTFRYDPTQRFSAWLKTVVDNAVRDFLRNLKRRPAALGSGDTDVQKGLEQVATPTDVEGLALELEETLGKDLEQAWAVIARVKARVEPHIWQAYWLTAMEGRSPKEVAEQLGMSTVSVYKAKSRVSKMLRAEGMRPSSQGPGESEVEP